MKILYWSSALVIFYVYIAYPFLLDLLSRLKPRHIRKSEYKPIVTIIIAAYNEESNIRKKIENTLSLDYPKDKLEIFVASDGSTDRTDEIVRSFEREGIILMRQHPRRGKTAAQNSVAKIAKGEVIIFSDANNFYRGDAVLKIVRNFADPDVGCVGGNVYHISDESNFVGSGGGLYWKYENWIKISESRFGSLIGVYGGLYGVRKEIYQILPEDLISDFLIALETSRKGYRTVFEIEAVGTEKASNAPGAEFQMRVRVALRSFRAIIYSKWALNIFRYPKLAWQLLSHKILRYSVPCFLILLFISNIFIAGLFYRASLFGQLIFYGIATLGFVFQERIDKIGFFFVPSYFCLVNIASLVAFIKMLKGEKYITWETIRS